MFIMNKYERIPERIVDLHGCTINEAEETLDDLLQEVDIKKKDTHVRVIVGKGNHSVNGAVLQNFVKRYLFLRNIRFNQSKLMDGGEGALEVFLSRDI